MAKHRMPTTRSWPRRFAIGTASTLGFLCIGVAFAGAADAKTHHGPGAPGNAFSAPHMIFSATSIVQHGPKFSASGGSVDRFTTGTGALGTGQSTTSILKSANLSAPKLNGSVSSLGASVSGLGTSVSGVTGIGSSAGTDTAGSVVHTGAGVLKHIHKH